MELPQRRTQEEIRQGVAVGNLRERPLCTSRSAARVIKEGNESTADVEQESHEQHERREPIQKAGLEIDEGAQKIKGAVGRALAQSSRASCTRTTRRGTRERRA